LENGEESSVTPTQAEMLKDTNDDDDNDDEDDIHSRGVARELT
jgi:hypothetical protein